MISVTDQASDQAKFAAREFLARIIRETGGEVSAIVADRMLFAFEMGYLRGRSDGMLTLSAMYDELRKKVNDGCE